MIGISHGAYSISHFCINLHATSKGRSMRAAKFKRPGCHSSGWVLFSLLLVLLLFSQAFAAPGEQSGVKITILHLNDTHGHIIPFVNKSTGDQPVSGAAYFSEMIKHERAANPGGALLLSAGDMFQGTPESNLFHGRSVIEVMNYLKFDAMALGNHEFDWGQDVLREIIASAAFPVLSANITGGDGKYFDSVKPWIIIKRKDIPIGIIGLTTPETQYTTKPGNLAGLAISSPESVLPSLIKEVRAKGAALIVVLSHLGLDEDRKLAAAVPGIDVIVGGHSHTVVHNPVIEAGTIIVQAGCYGEYLGVLDIYFDPAGGKILKYTQKNELELVKAGPKAKSDPGAAKIVEKYESKVRGEFSRVAGNTSVDLVRQAREESNIGDLIADAMRESTGAQIAFQNGGGIRGDILQGPITLEAIYTVLPFDNLLVSMDLTGEQVKNLLEHCIDTDKILQISGLKVEYDPSGPDGSKIVSIIIDEKPLDPAASYRVTTNDFLAAGGDRFTDFTQGRNPVIGSNLRDAVSEYIKKHSPIETRTQGRITFKKKEGPSGN